MAQFVDLGDNQDLDVRSQNDQLIFNGQNPKELLRLAIRITEFVAVK